MLKMGAGQPASAWLDPVFLLQALSNQPSSPKVDTIKQQCNLHKADIQVEEKVKRAMGQNTLDDGEFWMEFFSDFCREFEEVSICTLGPDFNHDGIVDASQVRHGLYSLRV